jgi:hypothetical protein
MLDANLKTIDDLTEDFLCENVSLFELYSDL